MYKGAREGAVLLKIPVQPVMMLEETASYMEGGMVEGPHYTISDQTYRNKVMILTTSEEIQSATAKCF